MDKSEKAGNLGSSPPSYKNTQHLIELQKFNPVRAAQILGSEMDQGRFMVLMNTCTTKSQVGRGSGETGRMGVEWSSPSGTVCQSETY